MARVRNTKIQSEAYAIRKVEEAFLTDLEIVMTTLGAGRVKEDHEGRPFYRTDEVNGHFYRLNWDSDERKRNEVGFSEFRYNKELSEIVYGDIVTIEDDKEEVDGYARTFDNRASLGDSVASITDTVVLTDEETNQLDQNYHFDITSNTSVEGSYGGAKITQDVTVNFGLAIDKKKSTTEGKSVERSINTDITVPAGKRIQVSFEKNKIKTQQPFSVDGVLDFTFEVNFEDWANTAHIDVREGGKDKIKFSSMREFEQFMEGYNVAYPRMRTFLDDCPYNTYEAYMRMIAADSRKVSVAGVKTRIYEDNINIVVKDLD